MFTWFGEPWGAPVNQSNPHTRTPVGTDCDQCGKPIEASDRGFIFPMLDPDDPTASRWHVMHHACLMAMIGPTHP